MKRVLDAHDLVADYGFTKRQAYAVLAKIGVRITPRRLVVLRERLEAFLAGS